MKQALLFIIITQTSLFSQWTQLTEPTELNWNQKTDAIFFEAIGLGALYSVDYEKVLFFKKNKYSNGIALTAGISFVPEFFGFDNHNRFFLPLSISYTYQNEKNRFDFGTAVTFWNEFDNSIALTHFLLIRYIRPLFKSEKYEGGIMFSPAIRDRGRNLFQLWGGLRFGIKLEK